MIALLYFDSLSCGISPKAMSIPVLNTLTLQQNSEVCINFSKLEIWLGYCLSILVIAENFSTESKWGDLANPWFRATASAIHELVLDFPQ